MDNEPLVSIIIPTRNAGRVLSACLESIKRQTYRHIEVIVIDQESEDNTLEIAKSYNCQIISLPKPLFYTPPTKSRNAGARAAKGDIFYNLDADMELSPDLIAEAIDRFSADDKLGALVVHEVDITKGFWSKAKAFERRCYWNNDKIESARICRRLVFETAGGYDENISSGEDFDIHARYKKVTGINFCVNTVFHQLGYLNFFKLLNKKYSYGKTASLYFAKTGTSGAGLLKEQMVSYLKNYRQFIKHPFLGFCSVFLKLAEFMAGFCGYLAYKKNKYYGFNG